jgi:hypothetical protein
MAPAGGDSDTTTRPTGLAKLALRQTLAKADAAVSTPSPTTLGTVTSDGDVVVVSAHGAKVGGLAGALRETESGFAVHVNPSSPTRSTFVVYEPAGRGGGAILRAERMQFGDIGVGCDPEGVGCAHKG